MTHKIHRGASGVEVRFSQRVTFQEHDSFADVLQLLQEGRDKRCVFQLGSTDFVDSAALGMFLLARETAQARGVDIVLKGARGKVRDVMQVARFDTLFVMED